MPYNPFLGFCRRVPLPIKFPQAVVSSLMSSGNGRSLNYETHDIIWFVQQNIVFVSFDISLSIP